MKRFLFVLIFQIIFTLGYSQSWEVVGSRGFAMSVGDCFTAVSPDDTPYIVTRAGHGISVMKFLNNQWEYVGDTLIGAGNGSTIAFDKIGTPFIAYTDWAHDKKATVLKFNGISWVPLEKFGFTPGCASFLSIAFDSNNIPHIAFRDKGNIGGGLGPNGYRASVMKFNGSSWVYVGIPGFSPNASIGGAGYISMAFDGDDKPYVGFTDCSNDFMATVMNYDGSVWRQVGSVVSDGQAANTTLVIDRNNTPYLAFWDRENGGKATVKKYDGSNWISVGSEGLTSGIAEFVHLKIDKNDVLYLIFEDYDNNERASVLKFDGNNWVPVGNMGFSQGRAYYTTLAVDSKGNLYACYWDCPLGWFATVMKYANPVTIKEESSESINFNVYPNPSKSIFTLEYAGNSNSLSINITNQIGQIISSKNYSQAEKLTESIDLGREGKGIYFVELISGKEKKVRKVVVE